jgi:hypothetical protein
MGTSKKSFNGLNIVLFKVLNIEPLAKLLLGYGMRQGTTSVVPQRSNQDSGFSRCEDYKRRLQIAENKTAGAEAQHY